MSAARDRWIKAGSPTYGVMQPVADLKAVLAGYGYTVGTVGDKRHQEAKTPEDHTWFSVTGWPSAALIGWCYAGDVMKPSAGSGLPSLIDLGEQIARDRNAGVPGTEWIKYVNRELADGRCIHEAWDPAHRITSSSDRGHIHISGRTDFRTSTTVRTNLYDPVARLRGGVVPVVHRPENTGYPAYGGRVLTARRPMMHGADVRTGQQRLRERGWRITVDGWYGPQTELVVRKFQTDSTRHGWSLASDGALGPMTWRALWLRPVS